MFFMFYFITFFQSNTDVIHMSKEPLNNGRVKLEHVVTLDGREDGFYRGVNAHVYKQKIYVYDYGNKKFHIYDLNGVETNSFGNEGNGPGEFNGYLNISVNDDYIYFMSYMKTMLFNHDGKFIKEIKREIINGEVVIGKQIINYKRRELIKTAIYYDTSGKLIKKSSKEDQSKLEPYKSDAYEVNLKKNYLGPAWLIYSEGKYYRHHINNYKIDVFNERLDKIAILTRPFDRIKIPSDWQYIITGDKKRDAKLNRNYRAELTRINGGYESDIARLCGTSNENIFVWIRSNDTNNQYLDVISPEYKFSDQLKIPISSNEVSKIKVFTNFLVVTAKNDDVGPYVKIYKLKI